jgi:hypothetical protein
MASEQHKQAAKLQQDGSVDAGFRFRHLAVHVSSSTKRVVETDRIVGMRKI